MKKQPVNIISEDLVIVCDFINVTKFRMKSMHQLNMNELLLM